MSLPRLPKKFLQPWLISPLICCDLAAFPPPLPFSSSLHRRSPSSPSPSSSLATVLAAPPLAIVLATVLLSLTHLTPIHRSSEQGARIPGGRVLRRPRRPQEYVPRRPNTSGVNKFCPAKRPHLLLRSSARRLTRKGRARRPWPPACGTPTSTRAPLRRPGGADQGLPVPRRAAPPLFVILP
jgi:hypothetical protein